MLIDRQRLSPGMTGDELQFSIGQPAVSSQPCDALMPKRVRGGCDASLFRIELDDLLNTPSCVLRVASSLEQPAIVGMSGDMGSQGRGEGFAEENVTVLVPLPAIDPNLVILKVDVADLDAAQFTDSHGSLEQQPQHQGVLHVIGPVYEFVEAAEVIGVQDAWEPPPLLGRSKGAFLPHLFGDVSPSLVVQPRPANDSSDLGHNF